MVELKRVNLAKNILERVINVTNIFARLSSKPKFDEKKIDILVGFMHLGS